MNPLSPSSSNLERARLDATRAAPANELAKTETSPGASGFADLLRGAQAQPASAAPAQAAPAPAPVAARKADTQVSAPPADPPNRQQPSGRQLQDARDARRLVQRQDEARGAAAREAAGSEGAADPSEAVDEAGAADQTEPKNSRGDTLAHWLLSQGMHVGAQVTQAGAAGLPPPQDAAPATDDLKAAAMAREVLDAVRSRAKASASGEGQAGGPARASVDTRAAADSRAAAADPVLMRDAAAGLGPVASAAAEPASLASKPGRHEHLGGSADFAQTLGSAVASQAAALPAPLLEMPAAGGVAERSIDTPLNDPAFGAAVGVSISRLVGEGVQEARLQLNPAELGPVSVRIALHGSEARIELGAALADTRALLDASMPALAEALRADGLVLAASQVSEWRSDSSGSSATDAGSNAGSNNGSQSAAWAGDGAASNSRQGAGSGSRGGGGSDRQPAGEPLRMAWPATGAGPAEASAAPPRRSGLGGLDLYA